MKSGRKKGKSGSPLKGPVSVRWNGTTRLVRDLARDQLNALKRSYDTYQSVRDRDAVYEYLRAVYEFASGFESDKDCEKVGRVMIKAGAFVLRSNHDQFGLILRATSSVEHRARWKWATCLNYAMWKDVSVGDLQGFIQTLGGINGCAERAVEGISVEPSKRR